MQIEIKEISNEKEWSCGLELFSYTTLFLSWEWTEFERRSGKKFETFGVYKNDSLVGLLTLKNIHAKRGSYLHVRHGPLINWNDSEVVENVVKFLKSKAKINGSHFIRISPLIPNTQENYQMLKNLGFKQSVIHATDAELTVTIDLTQSEADILKNMRKTTRNMIRKAEKVGVEVRSGNDQELFDGFAKVYKDTTDRNKWTAYSLSYIKKEFEIFQKNGNADIFVSYYNGEPISAAIFIRHRDQVIYHFGGSLSKYRDIPASYLTQWEAVKFYKRKGLKLYNFWGVSPEGMKHHPWYGFSLFKRGFSQHELEFVHSHDMDMHPFAKLTHLYEYVEARVRGYR